MLQVHTGFKRVAPPRPGDTEVKGKAFTRRNAVKTGCRCLQITTVQAAKMRRRGDLKRRRRDPEQLRLLLCGAEWFRLTVAAWLTLAVSVHRLVDSLAPSRRSRAALAVLSQIDEIVDTLLRAVVELNLEN